MKLYGLGVSNYYNVAKLGLLEKGLEFDEVETRPNREEWFLAISPMGKMPALQFGEHSLSESQAILHYLEALKPEPRLFPTDPYLAGLAQQIHMVIALYIDGVSRKLLPAAYFGATAEEDTIVHVSQDLEKGTQALARLTSFEPFTCGDSFSHADIAAFNHLPLTQSIMTRLGAPDPFANLTGYAAYIERLSQRPNCQRILEDQRASFAKIMAAGRG